MGNVWFTKDGLESGTIHTSCFMDFGCSRPLIDGKKTDVIKERIFSSEGFTPLELLPARWESGDGTISIQADLFSVGCLMLHCLFPENYWAHFGTSPVIDSETLELDDAERLGINDSLCEKVNAILAKAMHPELSERYPSADAMLEAIRQLKRDTEPPEYLLPTNLSSPDYWVPHSRDTELTAIAKSVNEGETVYLHGVGGIGKTECAIKLAKRLDPPRGAYLVHFQNSMRETVLKMSFSGYKFAPEEKGLSMEDLEEAEYQARLDILKEHYRDTVLILDNFDADNKTLDDLRREPAFKDFLGLKLKRIVTTRYPMDRKDWEIRELSENDVLKLMRFFCTDSSITDEQYLAILGEIQKHTLTAILVAKTLEESWGDVTPEMILEALRGSRLSQEEYPEVVSDQNRSYHQKQIYEHLRALFDLSKMNNHDRTILRCATLLSDDGMDASLFRSCFQSEEQKALSTLVKRGWLTRSKRNKLTIHPVIREVCREELRDYINSCSDFLACLWRNYDRNTFHLEKYKEMAHVFSCACESNEIFIPPYAHCAWALHLELGDGLSALKYAHAELSHVENTRPLSLQTLATCLHRVGMAYGRSGNPRKSLEYHKRALSIRETIGSSDTHLLSSSYIDVSVASSKMGSYTEALAYAIKALELGKKGATPDDLELAHAYNVVGCCYGYLKDNENSYLYLKKALSIREKSLPDDHPELAEAYGNLAAACADVNESISYDQKAIAIRQNIFGTHHPELALSYSNIASNYARLGDFKTAIQYCLQAIEIQESALPPLHPDLAHSFSNIAKIYRAQGDYHKGQLYNEKALSIRTKTLPHNHPDRLASVHDSVWYATKLGNFIKIDEPRWITPDIPSTEALKIAEEASSCISNARTKELKENYDAQLKHLHKAEKLLLQILPADDARIIQLLTQIERCYEKKKEYTLACEYCQRLATLGDSFFIMKLGIWKMDGIGCEQNYDESFQLLKRAYELGHARAALDLGWLYLWGYGCKCDVLRAKELFEVQAHAPYNNKTACNYLGNLHLGEYEQSTGLIPVSLDKALIYYKKADINDPDIMKKINYIQKNYKVYQQIRNRSSSHIVWRSGSLCQELH